MIKLNQRQYKQVKPLQFEDLELLVGWLDKQLAAAISINNCTALLTHSRDQALLLIGLRAFSSDELCEFCKRP